MGNRAVITTAEDLRSGGTGLYLHWNGGLDSVGPFLEYCRLRGFRGLPGGGPTFRSLAALLGWLKRKGYDGRDRVWDVLALDPREDRPAMFALVPKNAVDRWMGVRD